MKKYQRIEDLRIDSDKTQKQVAEDLGMYVTTYARNERGESEVTFTNAIELSKYYKVSLDYIAGLTNDKGGLHGTAGELSNYFELNEENKKYILKTIDLLIEEQCRRKDKKSNITLPKAQ